MESILQMGKERLGEVRRPPQDHSQSTVKPRLAPSWSHAEILHFPSVLSTPLSNTLSPYPKQCMVFVLTRD